MGVVWVRGVFLGAWVCALEAESPVVCSVSRCPCLWVEIGVIREMQCTELWCLGSESPQVCLSRCLCPCLWVEIGVPALCLLPCTL